MTGHCRPDGFISLRRAKRAAWKRTDAGKPCEPVWCPACQRYHLTSTTAPTRGA